MSTTLVATIAPSSSTPAVGRDTVRATCNVFIHLVTATEYPDVGCPAVFVTHHGCLVYFRLRVSQSTAPYAMHVRAPSGQGVVASAIHGTSKSPGSRRWTPRAVTSPVRVTFAAVLGSHTPYARDTAPLAHGTSVSDTMVGTQPILEGAYRGRAVSDTALTTYRRRPIKLTQVFSTQSILVDQQIAGVITKVPQVPVARMTNASI